MKNLWNESEAREAVERYATKGVNADLALAVYGTRLLGKVTELVLHGGGNTSVKTTFKDTLGESVDVLCVKGSGWDMGVIEPPGLPAVRLAPLRKLHALDKLSDEAMVNYQRLNLLDAAAPNPSVETLFHAFLPAKYVDHTHSRAVLALTDQPDGRELAREIYGDRLVILDYVMPGFALAKAAGMAAAKSPRAIGILLLQHGLFTWAETSREAYDLHIDLVTRAEERLQRDRKPVFMPATLPANAATAVEVAPILRGLCALSVDGGDGAWRRWILEHRGSEAVLAYVNGAEIQRYANAGVVTPEQVIRTKRQPLIVPAPEAGKLDAFRDGARAALDAYKRDYAAYFERQNARVGGGRKMLDPIPRLILVPGVGIFALGRSAKETRIAADFGENAAIAIAAAEAIGRYQPIGEDDSFDVEYWPLEQAKIGKEIEKPLARQIAAVTGGGSGIGAATAEALVAAGTEIAVIDRDLAAAQSVARKLGGLAVAADVTRADDVAAAMRAVVARFGGLDVVVSNAGAAWQGRIGDVDDATLRASFELNFFAHQLVAREAVKIMRAQGTGGALLFNVSKQAVNPGPDLGPYGLPKAATLFLLRQYAIDHGKDGIRANGVNADRIRTGLLTDEMIAKRSKARGLSEADYMGGNLLAREVKARDVADAFVYLASALKTTGAVVTVDGGNIAAALR
jgi:rhamnose utilization protein RhaD (predicted bifunctional aldolase and dehydrogenase)/NAD(P)-dependent dehydrogenase (short-subunit alcohol dehydrogenase family)